jgi:MFS family permease
MAEETGRGSVGGGGGASILPRGARRRGMRMSTADGVFATIHGNLTGGVIFTSFLLTLGAQKYHFAILNAVSAIAQLPQVLSAFWMGRVRSRKALVVSSALASRLVLCLIVLLPYMMPFPAALKAILGAAFLWGALGSIASNAWTGWMSDLVPRRIRGRYFSSRNFALMIASIVSSLLLSWFLDQFSEGEPQGLLSVLPSLRGTWVFVPANKLAAFTLLYMFGAVPAIVSAVFVYRQFEPPREPAHELPRFLSALREPFGDGLFVRFLVFTCMYNFVNSFASPYWSPYCLDELRMPYFSLAVCGLISTTCGLLTARPWGRLCDRYGNRPVVIIVMLVVVTHPLYYLVARDRFLLPIYIDFGSSGAMWTGYGIAMGNLLLLFGTARTKEMFFAVYATSSALTIFVGSLLSGYIVTVIPATHLGPLRLNSVQVIFLFTSVLRLVSVFAAARLIVEAGSRRSSVVVRDVLTRRHKR